MLSVGLGRFPVRWWKVDLGVNPRTKVMAVVAETVVDGKRLVCGIGRLIFLRCWLAGIGMVGHLGILSGCRLDGIFQVGIRHWLVEQQVFLRAIFFN